MEELTYTYAKPILIKKKNFKEIYKLFTDMMLNIYHALQECTQDVCVTWTIQHVCSLSAPPIVSVNVWLPSQLIDT